MNDTDLIKNHTIFQAYFCHFLALNQVENTKEFCDIISSFEKEAIKRNISSEAMEACINKAVLEPQDSILVEMYFYPHSINMFVAQS